MVFAVGNATSPETEKIKKCNERCTVVIALSGADEKVKLVKSNRTPEKPEKSRTMSGGGDVMSSSSSSLGLSTEQTVKLLQFQDLTGIDDLSVCRDVLHRHRWDLEVFSLFATRLSLFPRHR